MRCGVPCGPVRKLIGERGRVSHTAQRGIPGYGTAQELLFMRELLQRHRVRPDLVVQVFFTMTSSITCASVTATSQPSRPCFTLRNDALYLTQRPRKELDAADDTLVEAQRSPALP